MSVVLLIALLVRIALLITIIVMATSWRSCGYTSSNPFAAALAGQWNGLCAQQI